MPSTINDKNVLKVTIFGADYPLKVSANLDYVHRVAEYVDAKMKEVYDSKQNRPLHQIAILAALNIADELFQQREQEKSGLSVYAGKLEALYSRLESGIKVSSENDEKVAQKSLDQRIIF